MRLFLSHDSADKPLVQALQQGLPRHIKPWLDVDQLYAGKLLAHSLRRAVLDDNDFFVVFVGARSLASPWVRQELQWALEREAELGRTFVVPLMLPDAPAEPPAEPPWAGLWQRIWLACPADGAGAAAALAQHLFLLLSNWVEEVGDTSSPRRYAMALKSDLTRLKDAAYQMLAAMGAPLPVLATRPEAHAQFAQAVGDYDRCGRDFIARKDRIEDELERLFGGYLAAEGAKLLRYVEEELWRGRAFALNAVVDYVNGYEAGLHEAPAKLAAAEAHKAQLLADTRKVLEGLTRRSLALLRKLEMQ